MRKVPLTCVHMYTHARTDIHCTSSMYVGGQGKYYVENTTQGCELRGGGWSLNPLTTVSEIHADDSTNKTPPTERPNARKISRGAHGLGGFPIARRECERQRDPAPHRSHPRDTRAEDQGDGAKELIRTRIVFSHMSLPQCDLCHGGAMGPGPMGPIYIPSFPIAARQLRETSQPAVGGAPLPWDPGREKREDSRPACLQSTIFACPVRPPARWARLGITSHPIPAVRQPIDSAARAQRLLPRRSPRCSLALSLSLFVSA